MTAKPPESDLEAAAREMQAKADAAYKPPPSPPSPPPASAPRENRGENLSDPNIPPRNPPAVHEKIDPARLKAVQKIREAILLAMQGKRAEAAPLFLEAGLVYVELILLQYNIFDPAYDLYIGAGAFGGYYVCSRDSGAVPPAGGGGAGPDPGPKGNGKEHTLGRDASKAGGGGANGGLPPSG